MTPPPGTLLVASIIIAAAGKATGIKIDLDVAAILVALAGIGTGVIGYRRLRVDRTKIVAEVADLSQLRLERALNAAWENGDRLEEDVRELRAELSEAQASLERAHRAIGDLTKLLERHGLEAPELAL